MSLPRPSISKVTIRLFDNFFIDSSQYSLTDFKKSLLELKLQGVVNDKIKKCAGYEFRLKIGTEDEIIAEWFEGKNASSMGKIMKKIRLPMKFAYLNANITLEVTPYIDEKIT